MAAEEAVRAGEEPPEPAELQAENLDEALLRRLFEDLDALAAIDEVRVKGAAGQPAQEQSVGLREARDLLLAGRIRAAQVVYEYRGRTWCDTVLRTADGHRLVRMESPRRAASCT